MSVQWQVIDLHTVYGWYISKKVSKISTTLLKLSETRENGARLVIPNNAKTFHVAVRCKAFAPCNLTVVATSGYIRGGVPSEKGGVRNKNGGVRNNPPVWLQLACVASEYGPQLAVFLAGNAAAAALDALEARGCVLRGLAVKRAHSKLGPGNAVEWASATAAALPDRKPYDAQKEPLIVEQ